MTISIIITTSPIPSNPDTLIIDSVIKSIKKFVNTEHKFNIIIACDGTEKENNNYLKFLKNLENKYPDIKIIQNNKKGHLSGNLRNAINHIDTKYILILQHDLPFLKPIYIDKIIEDMEIYPELKHVRFNKRKNIKSGWDNTTLFGTKNIKNNYNYILTESWSDQNHLCKKEYYINNVFPNVEDGIFMEQVMNKICKGYHNKYGTYIFGELNEDAYIAHIDGSETRRGKTAKECQKLKNNILNKLYDNINCKF